jgi:predicted DNA-binding ribbon-helix-helix protein
VVVVCRLGPQTMNQQTALYYSQIACDKVITQSKLYIQYYKGLNKLGEDEKKILEELIDEFEQVKEYLKENLK